jgi:hypothetical protein
MEDPDAAWFNLVDWDRLRAQLQLKPEPAVDPGTDIDQLHLSRWFLIPIEQVDDDRLVGLYHRARSWGMRWLLYRVSRVIAERTSLLEKGNIETATFYGELALAEARKENRAEAETWVRQGRQSEAPAKRVAGAVHWDMIELQIKIVLDGPEIWVPSLAGILERYRDNQEATSAVLFRLVELGLVHATLDPKHPNQLNLDTRVLERYMNQYGPRVTTPTRDLGVRAERGEIWTPEPGGGGTPLWTPGSASPASHVREKSNIILPGE